MGIGLVLACSSFAQNQTIRGGGGGGGSGTNGVNSFQGRQGNVSLLSADVGGLGTLPNNISGTASGLTGFTATNLFYLYQLATNNGGSLTNIQGAAVIGAVLQSTYVTTAQLTNHVLAANIDAGAGHLAAGVLPALSGDVTSSAGSAATTIAAGAVSLSKMANETASTILGNATGSPAAPQALTTIPTATVPAFTGDVTTPGGSLTTTIAGGAVSLSKMANETANTILGNATGSPAAPQALATLPTATVPAFTGDVTTPGGSLATTLATVNASPGTYGDATHAVVITVNAKGLATSVSSTPISGGGGTLGATNTFLQMTLSGGIIQFGLTNGTVIGYMTPSNFIWNTNFTVNGTFNVNSPTNTLAVSNFLATGWIACSNAIYAGSFQGTVGVSNLSGTIAAGNIGTFTGDVTSAGGSYALTIANGAVGLAKMANETANTILGNGTGSSAAPQALTTLPTATVPAFTGDVTTPGGSLTTTIAGGAVSLSKMANETANTILGNGTGSPSAPQALTVLPTATVPAFTGDVTTPGGSLSTTIATGAVGLSKMANETANTIIGNGTGSSAAPQALTTIPTATVPAFTGDVTTPGGSLATSIASGAVSLSKMANEGAYTTLANPTSGSAVLQALSYGQVATQPSATNALALAPFPFVTNYILQASTPTSLTNITGMAASIIACGWITISNSSAAALTNLCDTRWVPAGYGATNANATLGVNGCIVPAGKEIDIWVECRSQAFTNWTLRVTK